MSGTEDRRENRLSRERMLPIMAAALAAVDPRQAVLSHLACEGDALRIGPHTYPLDGVERILVVGAGKAGAPMAAAVVEVLGERVTGGSVNVKYGHAAGAGHWRIRFGRGGEPFVPPAPAATGPVALVEAAHPVPDAAGRPAPRASGIC